jgi:hypothetical protein
VETRGRVPAARLAPAVAPQGLAVGQIGNLVPQVQLPVRNKYSAVISAPWGHGAFLDLHGNAYLTQNPYFTPATFPPEGDLS